MNTAKFLVGVDEVGRGPLAGPVTVCAYALPLSKAKRLSPQKDSKALSPLRRKELDLMLRSDLDARYAVISITAKMIDKIGIATAIARAADRAVKKLALDPLQSEVLLDGGLRVDRAYRQRTIIRGDATEPIIAYASIVAKEHRDRYMKRIAKKYPQYGFAQHVGYGTRMHRDAIRRYGATVQHRMTFLRNILPVERRGGA